MALAAGWPTGSSTITETIFENRFHARAGAGRAWAPTSSSRAARGDRAGRAALSGRAGHGDRPPRLRVRSCSRLWPPAGTTIVRVYHLDRGYERMEEKLAALGARMRREG